MEKGIEYLRRKLNKKRWRVNVRYKYYEMKAVAVVAINRRELEHLYASQMVGE